MLNLNHLNAMLRKEFQQILADRSVFVVAFLLPLCLVALYGSALRMDIKPVSVAIVSPSADDHITRELFFTLSGSSYFDVTLVTNEHDADLMMRRHEISSKVSVPADLAASLGRRNNPVLLTLNGSDASQASIARSYLEGAVAGVLEDRLLSRERSYFGRRETERVSSSGSAGQGYRPVSLVPRNRFNEGNDSTIYLMAGQLVAVVTLMSAFMTSIVIAREYERGTMDGLLSTDCSAAVFLLSKIIPYYALSLSGAALALIAAFALYDLPFRGSFILFTLTVLVYLYLTMMTGLLISAVTKSQFLSSEYAVIVSFLPSILLSGALFDLRAVPEVISDIALLLPPAYAVESFKICILSGGGESALILNLLILLLFSLLLTLLCERVTHGSFVRHITSETRRETRTRRTERTP